VRAVEAFMLPLASGGRFCLFHRAAGRGIGAAVYVHPFAEEMNKSRRMAALQARALAKAGISVLQIDLLGCGDSAGDFGDATWSMWIDDVVEAVRWLHRRTGFIPLLWGLRSGCLLAHAALAKLPAAPDLVFWQPVISGKQHLQQFLRLRIAGELIGRPGAERTERAISAPSSRTGSRSTSRAMRSPRALRSASTRPSSHRAPPGPG
jgi:exosortase A-associated hydrolase 2